MTQRTSNVDGPCCLRVPRERSLHLYDIARFRSTKLRLWANAPMHAGWSMRFKQNGGSSCFNVTVGSRIAAGGYVVGRFGIRLVARFGLQVDRSRGGFIKIVCGHRRNRIPVVASGSRKRIGGSFGLRGLGRR